MGFEWKYHISMLVVIILIIFLQEYRKSSKNNGLKSNLTKGTDDVDKKKYNISDDLLSKMPIKSCCNLEWRSPPENREDPKGWDWYWEERLKEEEPSNLFFYFEILDLLIPVLREFNLKKILCAGNGISLEPYALASAGFEVTSVDLSLKAIDFMKNFQFRDKHLERFFSKEECRDGGSVQFLHGDLRDEQLCPGPYDVIITRRTLQLLPEDKRWKALESLEQRLSHKGVFISHDHNNYNATGPWFESRAYNISVGTYKGEVKRQDGKAFLSAKEGCRAAWIIRSSG